MSLKIGIFGGTFNPPHKGHVAAARLFASVIKPDIFYIIPSCVPPHKLVDGGAPTAHRFAMTRLAFADLPCDTVFSAIELARSGKGYTVDTLNELSALHLDADFFLYVGSDMLFSFESWKNFEDILSRVTLVTAPRDIADKEKVFEHCRMLAEKYGCKYEILPLVPFEISSTELRKALSDQDEAVCREYIPTDVYDYISQNKLYRESASNELVDSETLSQMERELSSFVDEKRFEHTLSVVDTALMLGNIFLPLYGENQNGLRELVAAALCHDMTKCKSESELTSYISQFMRSFEGAPAIYHSYASAYFALERYKVNPRVFRSIFYHTTGRADMDIFEKIIFVSDYIEPTRTHAACIAERESLTSELEKLKADGNLTKECATAALDRSVYRILRGTLEHLKESERPIDSGLYRAIEFYSAQI